MKAYRNVVDNLQLDRIGTIEFIVALYPILSCYQYGPIPLSLLTLVILFLVIRNKSRETVLHNQIKDLKRLTAFVLLHDFVWIFVMGVNTPAVFINSLISLSITLLTLKSIIPYCKWERLVGSINAVSLICVIGLFYQFIQVQNGESVGMLKLPLLPESGLSRHDMYPRPHSFFEEPASYSQYMLVPMIMGLIYKNYLWVGLIALSVLLSSSTTGLLLLFVLIIIYVLLGNAPIWSKTVIVLIGGSLIWLLLNSDLFTFAIEKFLYESENSSDNIRLAQGPAIVSTMNFGDFLFGAPYANAYDYCIKRGVSTSLFEIYGKGKDSIVYMTTFWQLLLRFGVTGFTLYILVFLKFIKYRDIVPLVICFLIMTYTAAFWFFQSFVFYVLIFYSYANHYELNIRNDNYQLGK